MNFICIIYETNASNFSIFVNNNGNSYGGIIEDFEVEAHKIIYLTADSTHSSLRKFHPKFFFIVRPNGLQISDIVVMTWII